MTLIKSISGIRGTVGGPVADNLTPPDVVRFTTAYAQWVKQQQPSTTRCRVVVGRDARLSGEMVNALVVGTLLGCGIDVLDIGLATTPTTEMAVQMEQAQGGIIITASHNPRQWNALKLLNAQGEFITDADGRVVLALADGAQATFAGVDELGVVEHDASFLQRHIERIVALPYVDREAIAQAHFKVAIDCVNSVGGIALPPLLRALGVEQVVELNTEPTGEFAHNPEPLPEHLTQIAAAMREHRADVGFVVDPDVDRLAIVNEDGSMFGEEYTLVACADYVLGQRPGNTVSNLSSTSALADITRQHGHSHSASAVGEVNVVAQMKATQATIGGEGNGGVILPELHYGRDALVGIALFLSHLARTGKRCSELRAQYPNYFISKNKIQLSEGINPDAVLDKLREQHQHLCANTADGLRLDVEGGWVHMRRSNTEPIIRIYAEQPTPEHADALATEMMGKIRALMG